MKKGVIIAILIVGGIIVLGACAFSSGNNKSDSKSNMTTSITDSNTTQPISSTTPTNKSSNVSSETKFPVNVVNNTNSEKNNSVTNNSTATSTAKDITTENENNSRTVDNNNNSIQTKSNKNINSQKEDNNTSTVDNNISAYYGTWKPTKIIGYQPVSTGITLNQIKSNLIINNKQISFDGFSEPSNKAHIINVSNEDFFNYTGGSKLNDIGINSNSATALNTSVLGYIFKLSNNTLVLDDGGAFVQFDKL